MAYVRIRPRRSTAEEWEYNNPILAEGEMGVEVPPTGVGTGTVKIKFGDGVLPWNELPYGINLDDFQPNNGSNNNGSGDDSGDDSGNTGGDSGGTSDGTVSGGIIFDENDKTEIDEIPTEED